MSVGELAVPVLVTAADTPMPAVEAMIRADTAIVAVLGRLGDTLYVVSRADLDILLAGRLGYGRALLNRRTLASVLTRPALVVPAATSLDEAAHLALGRPVGEKSAPIVVTYPDGSLGVAPVGRLAEHLADRYATLALRDALTGLGNRRHLGELASAALGRSGRTTALFVLDLDRFKDVNDALGHHSGDVLLRQVGAALQRASAGEGAVFRFGGDEFAVLIDNFGGHAGTTDRSVEDRLKRIGHRILAEVRGPFDVAGVPIAVEASLGIAYAPAHGADLTTLLARADAAMYTAKRDRTAVQVWEPDQAMAGTADLRLLAELRTAITDDQLRLHYQPLVDATTGTIRSVEALVRWQHPERGLLLPGAFIAQAERSEIIAALTDYVIAEAVAQAARWQDAGHPVPVSVNLPAPLLAVDHIVGLLTDTLDLHRIPPGRIVLEVTETAVMTRPDLAAKRLAAIRALGVRVAVDDFGTGYTSLALLTQLPLDELKLDRSFIARVHDRSGYAIVEAVATMAKHLGLTLVGEGVEDQRTADTLRGLGFDLLQGYHYGRPEPAATLSDRLRSEALATMRT